MKIYIANIDSISKDPDFYASFLPVNQQKRVTRFQNSTRKSQFILGHLMVLACDKKHTSIAHKDKFVVVAAASNALVGIDIENTTIERDFVQASQLINLPVPKSLNDFYRNFTLAEAAYKLGGRPRYRRFIRYNDYLICVVSSRYFDGHKLNKFNPDSFCVPKQQ